jgi:cell shape-determining protein MreC
MTKPALTPRRVLLLLVLFMVLSSLMPKQVAEPLSRYPHNAVDAVTQPFTNGLTAFSAWLRPSEAIAIEMGEKDRIIEENVLLQGQIMRLQEELRVTRESLEQLLRTEAVTGGGVVRIEARVTAQPPSRSQPIISISRGLRDGVREKAIVAWGESLVGQVVGVTPVGATVRLLTFPKQPPLAVIIRKPQHPPHELRTSLELSRDGDEFVATLAKNDPVSVDDLAYLMDEYWPPEARGFVVGKVVRVEDDPSDPQLRKRAIVRPLRPLESLTRVLVLMPAEAKP